MWNLYDDGCMAAEPPIKSLGSDGTARAGGYEILNWLLSVHTPRTPTTGVRLQGYLMLHGTIDGVLTCRIVMNPHEDNEVV